MWQQQPCAEPNTCHLAAEVQRATTHMGSRPVMICLSHGRILGVYLTYGLSSASMMLKQDATRALSTVVTGSFRCLRTKWTASGTMSSHSLPSSSLPSAAPAQQHSLHAHQGWVESQGQYCWCARHHHNQVDSIQEVVNLSARAQGCSKQCNVV